MKIKTATICMLAVIMAFIGIAFILNKPDVSHPPKPENGYLDLSGWSFEEYGPVKLKGTWEFYFNRFLTHEDFQEGDFQEPYYIAVPSTKKSMEAVKPFPQNTYCGTMRLVIRLPEGKKALGLRSDIILTSFSLSIDGVQFGEIGKAGLDGKSSEPYYNVLTSYFQPDSNEVELIYHTSDFTAGDSSIAAPRIGLASQIASEEQMGTGRDLFLFGMLFIMGIYHMGLFSMRTKDRAPFYFSIFCLLFALRMLLVGERFLPGILNLGFMAYGRMAYICVFLGFAALLGFLFHAMDGLFHRRLFVAGIAAGIISSVLILILPYPVFDFVLVAYAAVGFPLMAYAVVRLSAGAWKGRPFAGIVLLGFAALGITFVNDLLYQLSMENTPSLIPLGVAAFTFTQAYTLSAKFSNAYTRAEALSKENELILSDMKQLNSNLESLVKERTLDLKKALDEMEVMSRTDDLTKLPNRRMMLAKINAFIQEKRSFYIALLDVDCFKDMNDTFGHLKGDEILVRLSKELSAAVDGWGFAGRWGGEEFLIAMEACSDDEALEKADAVRRAAAECCHEDIGRGITVTIGLCRYREGASVDSIIAKADKAMYQGKDGGRNRCEIIRS